MSIDINSNTWRFLQSGITDRINNLTAEAMTPETTDARRLELVHRCAELREILALPGMLLRDSAFTAANTQNNGSY